MPVANAHPKKSFLFFLKNFKKQKIDEKKISKGHIEMQPLLGDRKSSGAGKVAATIAVGVALVLAGMVTSKRRLY
jgi:hypothetical protein